MSADGSPTRRKPDEAPTNDGTFLTAVSVCSDCFFHVFIPVSPGQQPNEHADFSKSEIVAMACVIR